MGKRGPAKTPTRIKQNRGSARGVAEAKHENKYLIGVPECPIEEPIKRAMYLEIASQLDTVGVLAETDRLALVELVDAHSFLQTIKAKMQDLPKDAPLRELRSLHQMYTAQKVIVIKLLREFGLTPSSRAALAPLSNTGPQHGNKGKEKKDKWGI